MGFFFPLQENWARDKEITCYATPADGQPVSTPYKAGGGQ
jgi:hypothetical protein